MQWFTLGIRRGIFQGESLSPLPLCISLIPLSLELNSLAYGSNIGTEQASFSDFSKTINRGVFRILANNEDQALWENS